MNESHHLLIRILMFLLFSSIFSISAFSQSTNNGEEGINLLSERIMVDLNVSGSIEVENPENVDYIEVTLNYFPKELPDQHVVSMKIVPEKYLMSKSNSQLFFIFQNLSEPSIEYNIMSTVEKTINIKNISSYIRFPISSLDEEYNKYITHSKTIDFLDPNVLAKARELAAGEDDLFVVVAKIAEWVNKYVYYNMTTVSMKASLPASWVLANKQGVCDEITNLFIALVRALGIPARFVVGISYTTSEEIKDKWGAHGWAEVYFPGYGWIPFDVTYKQYGYVDATHIVLAYSLESTDDSTRFRWKEHGSDVAVGPMKNSAALLSQSENMHSDFIMELTPFSSNVKMGSYNLIELKVGNQRKSYSSINVYLTRVNQVELFDDAERTITLKPLEVKSIYWLVKTPQELDPTYIFTSPLMVSSSYGTSVNATFNISADGTVYTDDELKAVMWIPEEDDLDENLTMSCTTNASEVVYKGASVKIGCTVRNSKENYEGMQLCIENDCRNFNVDYMSSYTTEFLTKIETDTAEVIIAHLSHPTFDRYQVINVPVFEAPNITISNLSYPSKVGIKEDFKVMFRLSPASNSVPKNIRATLSHKAFSQSLVLDRLNIEQEFAVFLRGSLFDAGKNDMTIFITYEDDLGAKYILQKSFSIELTNLTFMQKVSLGFRKFFRWVGSLF